METGDYLAILAVFNSQNIMITVTPVTIWFTTQVLLYYIVNILHCMFI